MAGTGERSGCHVRGFKAGAGVAQEEEEMSCSSIICASVLHTVFLKVAKHCTKEKTHSQE